MFLVKIKVCQISEAFFCTLFEFITFLFNPSIGATTPGLSGYGTSDNQEALHIPQSSRPEASPSDCLKSYPEHSLGSRKSHSYRDSVGVFYRPSRLGYCVVANFGWRHYCKRIQITVILSRSGYNLVFPLACCRGVIWINTPLKMTLCRIYACCRWFV